MAKTSTVTISTGGIGLDTRSFSRFAKALRKASPALYKGLILRLRAAGEIVLKAAQENVAPWSSNVEQSMRVRVSGATVAVAAGVGGLPIAALFELGNKPGNDGGRPAEGYFTHPVFGGRRTEVVSRRDAPWVLQSMHPYLLKALQDNYLEAETAAVEALDWAIHIAATDDLE